MKYIDMHAHMVSRTTDDYAKMAMTGCLAVTEPAFWAGYDRRSADVFADYFDHLTTFEPTRAAEYGIQHYCWLCLNPKEGEDRTLAKEVLAIIPEFLSRDTVLGIGEIGLNRVTCNELATFTDHVELALEHDQMIHIHTPHLEDKYKGTKWIVETLAADPRVRPERVMVDHAEEHTVGMILENGFWTGMTLYPKTKASPNRAIDMLEMYGSDRIIVASACDWGESDPVAVPNFVLEMRRRGHDEALIEKVILHNPARFLSQSPKFRLELPKTQVPDAGEPLSSHAASRQLLIGGTHPDFVPSIHLVHDSTAEAKLEEQLLELFAQYDLSKWFYAETVNIEDGVLPNSYPVQGLPVVTLSPITPWEVYLGNPDKLLYAYIHEQMHWFSLLADPKRTLERFDAEVRSRYPNLPIKRPEGCGSERSNYIYIEVNFFEYQAYRHTVSCSEQRRLTRLSPVSLTTRPFTTSFARTTATSRSSSEKTICSFPTGPRNPNASTRVGDD